VSIYPEIARSRWIVDQRGAKNKVQEDRPYAYFTETERSASGRRVEVDTVFLTNKECPWRCLMCDLWKNTLDQEVQPGMIPTQIRHALDHLPGSRVKSRHLKLYNSGSFFDPHAIPKSDRSEIATIANDYEHLVVECHPSLIDDEVLRFRESLRSTLEIAMGLETVHPEALAKLNKGMDLVKFRNRCQMLKANGVFVRVFLLLQPPFVPVSECYEWAMRGVSFARDCGADVMVLIPTRTGNGALDLLHAAGEFQTPPISLLERSVHGAIQPGNGRVFADTWDLERFASCPYCLGIRKARLEQINLSQEVPCPQYCDHCQSTF
jgi:radical SAM enzyme (TIGR01210 family)